VLSDLHVLVEPQIDRTDPAEVLDPQPRERAMPLVGSFRARALPCRHVVGESKRERRLVKSTDQEVRRKEAAPRGGRPARTPFRSAR
jgi:hypothetical protein